MKMLTRQMVQPWPRACNVHAVVVTWATHVHHPLPAIREERALIADAAVAIALRLECLAPASSLQPAWHCFD